MRINQILLTRLFMLLFMEALTRNCANKVVTSFVRKILTVMQLVVALVKTEKRCLNFSDTSCQFCQKTNQITCLALATYHRLMNAFHTALILLIALIQQKQQGTVWFLQSKDAKEFIKMVMQQITNHLKKLALAQHAKITQLLTFYTCSGQTN